MAKFDVFFINLDSAPERRATLEASFAAANFSDNWKLHRFPAYGKDSPEVIANLGKQSPAYKGNYISHYECLLSVDGSDTHTLMCEDDCDFAPGCGDYLERLVAQLPEKGWDVILTDVTFLSGFELPVFLKLRERNCTNRIHLINLKGFNYAYTGSSCYLVNKNARKKMYDLLVEQRTNTDFPYDVVLRASIYHDRLVGLLVFPFITAPSIHANTTQAPYHQLTADKHVIHQLQMWGLNCMRRVLSIHYDPTTAIDSAFLDFAAAQEYSLNQRIHRDVVYWLQLLQNNSYYKEFEDIQVLDIGLDLPPPPAES